MTKRWVVHEPHFEAASIAAELGIHPAIASILLRRGHRTPAEISNFLNPSVDSFESPFAFSDMSKAVERIRRAVAGREKILIYGDYDVDGITGSAILYPILQSIGADVEAHIPHRIEEGYGLNQESLKNLLKKKFGLVITVDNGITGVEPIKFLAGKGVDTLVVDHHEPKEEIPPAYAIISAAVHEKKGDPNLAACGLAFKLGWALLGSFDAAKEYLDLAALGTIADLAPVVGDNRVLLKHGLPALARTKRVGLRALMDVAGISRNFISYRDIGFGLGPRINASGRMGSPLNAFKLLTTESELAARNFAQLLDEGNRDRQRAEAAAFEEALDFVERELLAETQKILVLDSPDWHEGVLGIVASRLVDRYRKPSIVISMKNGVGKGSGRSVPAFSLLEPVSKCGDLLIHFGGHAQALGLGIHEEKLPHFRKRVNEVAAQSGGLDSAMDMEIEAELPLGQADLKFLQALEKLSPFGPGNRKPLFLSRGVRVKGDVKKRGQDTLQCWVSDAEGKTICEVIGFRAFNRWNASRPGQADIVYQPSLKNFNGIQTIQLELEDWR